MAARDAGIAERVHRAGLAAMSKWQIPSGRSASFAAFITAGSMLTSKFGFRASSKSHPPCYTFYILRFELHHEYAVQSAEKFIADLLAIVASAQDSEDQQIAAAKKLSTAYAADLRAWMGKWVGKVSGDQVLLSVHKAIVEEQNRHRSESRAWRVLQTAELVIGDEKTNLRLSPRPRPSGSSISPRGGRFPGAGSKTR